MATPKSRPYLTAGLALSLLLVSFPGWSASDYFTWTDEKGVVHYSGQPPLNQKATKVEGPYVYKEEGEAAAEGTPPPAAAKQPEKPAAPAAAPTPPKADPARCAQAQKNLQTLQQKARVRTQDENGMRYLTPEEIEEQRSINQDILSSECQ